MEKNGICKACGKGYRKIPGERKFCGPECRAKSRGKIRQCKPKCKPENLSTRIVTFKNGMEHRQQYCSKCWKTKYVPMCQEKAKKVKELGKLGRLSVYLTEKYGESFYTSEDWIRLRFKALKEYGRECMCCGRKDGKMHVDHIKPRSRFPELALEFDNLQILCAACNLQKLDKNTIDFRKPEKVTAGWMMRVYEL